MTKVNTHGAIVDFGKTFKGALYTRVPTYFLHWMIKVGHEKAHIAEAELERRGTAKLEIEVSGHAFDRASKYLHEEWLKAHKATGIGFWSWVNVMAMSAWKESDKRVLQAQDGAVRCYKHGVCWVFDSGYEWPVLKTVIREKKRENKKSRQGRKSLPHFIEEK